jgi:YfiH family protein
VRTGSLGPSARIVFADRGDGTGRPPYDRGNLADHVGDDPAAVAANRAVLAAALPIEPALLVAMSPVHGAEVAQVRAEPDLSPPAVDAMVTTDPDCALLVIAADCVPVLLADGAAGVVGVAHAGWRGVRADVVGQVLGAMKDLGARSGRLRAAVGPAICGRCFQVGPDVHADVVRAAPAARTDDPGRLDLRAAVVARLLRAGARVDSFGGCTAEQQRWFSYRRDSVTGRHGGAVMLGGWR